MSTFQFSTRGTVESRQQLQPGSFKGHCVPQQLGMASHSKRALRPTKKGHCVPQKKGIASHSKWTWRPTEKGHGVPVSVLQLGEHIVTTFFPHRCNKQLGSEAIAAAEWFAAATCWQHLPWYEPILGYLQSFRQASKDRVGPKWPFLPKAAKQPCMVAKEYKTSCSPVLNNERCELHLPFAQQPFSASLLQK